MGRASSQAGGAPAFPALRLLGTRGCHLCDVAEGLLRQAASARRIDWAYVDIALDDALVVQYGERIPVLIDSRGSELGWPFSLLDVLRVADQISRQGLQPGLDGLP